jgi:hypothetical protein
MRSKSTFVLKNHLHVHNNDDKYNEYDKYNMFKEDYFIKNNTMKITYNVDEVELAPICQIEILHHAADEVDNTKLQLPIVTKDSKRFFKKQKWQSEPRKRGSY